MKNWMSEAQCGSLYCFNRQYEMMHTSPFLLIFMRNNQLRELSGDSKINSNKFESSKQSIFRKLKSESF